MEITRARPQHSSRGQIRSGQLKLPLLSVADVFKVAVIIYRDSEDMEKVRCAGIITRSECKWATDTLVAQAENMLRLKDIMGNLCTGRSGLRTKHF